MTVRGGGGHTVLLETASQVSGAAAGTLTCASPMHLRSDGAVRGPDRREARCHHDGKLVVTPAVDLTQESVPLVLVAFMAMNATTDEQLRVSAVIETASSSLARCTSNSRQGRR